MPSKNTLTSLVMITVAGFLLGACTPNSEDEVVVVQPSQGAAVDDAAREDTRVGVLWQQEIELKLLMTPQAPIIGRISFLFLRTTNAMMSSGS